MERASRTSLLTQALADYEKQVSSSYDEVLTQVTNNANTTGSLGKLEIGALIAWKRLNASTRWVGNFMATPDSKVHATTRAARDAMVDHTPAEAAAASRSALVRLPGFTSGDAVASAVLCALSDQRLAVYDKRAHLGLTALQIELTNMPGRYARYTAIVEQLRDECRTELGRDMTARQVDLALYTIGGNPRI